MATIMARVRRAAKKKTKGEVFIPLPVVVEEEKPVRYDLRVRGSLGYSEAALRFVHGNLRLKVPYETCDFMFGRYVISEAVDTVDFYCTIYNNLLHSFKFVFHLVVVEGQVLVLEMVGHKIGPNPSKFRYQVIENQINFQDEANPAFLLEVLLPIQGIGPQLQG